MATTMRAVPPPRSPERAKLADAISKRDASAGELARVHEGLGRIDDDIFERLEPACRARRQAVEQALRAAPALLVAKALGEPADPDQPTVAAAEASLKDADQALNDARQARSMLRDELRRREYEADLVRRAVDAAVKAVISSDPATKAVLAEFFATGRHVLRLASVLRTLGEIVTGVSADDLGLHLRVGDQLVPGNHERSNWTPEPAFLAALTALRQDADQPLPGLPPGEEDDVGDGTAAAAA